MISYIPEADREYYKRLQKQGKLPRHLRLSGDYLVNTAITEDDIISGSEVILDKYGLYQGLK